METLEELAGGGWGCVQTQGDETVPEPFLFEETKQNTQISFCLLPLCAIHASVFQCAEQHVGAARKRERVRPMERLDDLGVVQRDLPLPENQGGITSEGIGIPPGAQDSS